MSSLRRSLAATAAVLAAWRLLGPEVPPRFRGRQERPPGLTGRTVVAGRHEYFLREAGPEDGPPIVLLHGWAYDGHVTWHRVAPVLAETHRVYVLDLRGHGKTARIRGRFDVEDLADEVAAVMDVLGLGAVPVAGCSMGGMVAQMLARRHPGRVSRLVLVATAAQPVAVPRWLAVAAFTVGRAIARLDRLIAPRIAYRYLLQTGAIPPEHGSWLWECLLDRDADLYYEAGFAILRFDAGKWVGRIGIPTLSIVPTHDQLIPASRQRATAEALTDNRVVELEGARHEAVLTHAPEVAKAIKEFVS